MYRVFAVECRSGLGSWLLATMLALPLGGGAGPALAQGLSALERQVEAVIRDSWENVSTTDARRLVQDDTQLDCSRARNQPGEILRARIQARERERIVYPPDGLRLGNAAEGERLVRDGYGSRVGRLRPDDPARANGGNCQACHVLEPRDDSGGNLGPPLVGYGIGRGMGPAAVRDVYDRIYNPHALNPCSVMPRFGYHGFLTPEQILDIAAYLLLPDSPVNRLEALREAPAGAVRPPAP